MLWRFLTLDLTRLAGPRAALILALAGLGLALHPARLAAEAPEPGAEQDAAQPCSPAWLRAGLNRAPEDEVLMWQPPLGSDPVQAPDALLLAPKPGAAELSGGDEESSVQSITRPNDTQFRNNRQYFSLKTIGALNAWETSFGANDVTIAVIADGVETTHPDLRAKIWRNPGEVPGNGVDDDGNGFVDDLQGWDFGDEDADPNPIPEEQFDVAVPPTGTAMAGIAAAETNNDWGIAGVSWGARIMPLKILFRTSIAAPDPGRDPDGDGRIWLPGGRIESLTRAICYAADQGAEVIVIGAVTLYAHEGISEDLQRAQDAIKHATLRGASVVAGAGECGTHQWWCPDPARYGENPPMFPAAFSDVIGVQSFGPQYQRRGYASSGHWVDLAAPGEWFATTWRDGGIGDVDSNWRVASELAAAHVAGVIAVMKSLNPTLRPWDIEGKLCETAGRSFAGGPYPDRSEQGGWARNDGFGCGPVDFERAVEEMPWQVRVLPASPVLHMVSASEARARRLFWSPFLNEERWAIVSDRSWLQSLPLPQSAGAPSRVEVTVDVDAMRREQGGLATGGKVTTTVLARALNPDHPDQAEASVPQRIDYTIYVVDDLRRLYLPFASR